MLFYPTFSLKTQLADDYGEIDVRAYSLVMAFGLLLAILLGLQILALPTSESVIQATIEIQPGTLNLMEEGVITVFIRLPAPFSVGDIDVSSVRFDGQPHLFVLRGHVEEDKLVVKFDASLVTSYIWGKLYHVGMIPGRYPYIGTISIIITGALLDATPFESEPYEIEIIQPKSP